MTRLRRRSAALFAALVLVGGATSVLLPSAGASTRAGTEDAGEEQASSRAIANLEIIEEGVSVRREGAEEFRPGRDGQRLRVGDTVKTDATGFAQITYREEGDTFTRLDVNTEFTLVSISDDQGNRKVDGSINSGRVWNRAEGLTESESFQTEGAGATAVVEGTAYLVSCLSPGNCIFISVVNGITLQTVDGELQAMQPLQQCDATEVTDADSNLCAVPQDVALEVLLADEWIAKNIFLDALAGFPVPVVGIVTVEDGQVTSFTPGTPPAGTPAGPAGPTGPTGPTVPSPAVEIVFGDNDYQADDQSYDYIETDEFTEVYFMLLGDDPNGGDLSIVFVDFNGIEYDDGEVTGAATTVGELYYQVEGGSEPSYELVQLGVEYPADTLFLFYGEIDDGCQFCEVSTESHETQSGSFTFKVKNAQGQESAPHEVPVIVHEDHGCEECSAAQAVAPSSPVTPDAAPAPEPSSAEPNDQPTPPPAPSPEPSAGGDEENKADSE